MSDFESAAKQVQPTGFFAEFWAFLRQTKKWWLLPIVTVLIGFGLLALVSSTAAAPFIYTLF
jgi:hypothetical protein